MSNESSEPNYAKYLEAEPTALMKHIEEWLREKSGFDPSKVRTKSDAFRYGVYLTVHLRGIHQASPENQARLAMNRSAAMAEDDEREKRRAERAALGAKPRGRLPKAVTEEAEVPAKPKARAKAKATAPVEAPAPAKRRGRPKKEAETAVEAPNPARAARTRKPATALAAEAEETPAAPRRRGRPRKTEAAPVAATAPTETPSNVTELPTDRATRRRRPVRKGEAAF